MIEFSADDNEELISLTAEAFKDAARYRFIKSHFKPEYGDIADYWVLNGAVETAFDDLTTLDSAIDATMKDEGK